MSKEIDIKHQKHSLPATNEAWRNFRQEIARIFDNFSDDLESVSPEPFTRKRRKW